MSVYTGTASSVGQFITVLLIFLFVLGITYFATRYVGNFQKERLSGSNITVVETQRIAQNKYIQIVKIGDRYFAVALCKDTVTMISEISVDSLSLKEEEETKKLSFRDLLDRVREDEEKKDE
ncbi:MAG: flagellar biosynthetic protein FliO [Lachnospiraceae bacterium]|jgi:flagellar protein FliO/FliZ|nr:flagellar biosynthetic protein FliO [Lachnospiraceae bacterium]